MSARPSFFAELRPRDVYKVAVVDAVIAWPLIQAAVKPTTNPEAYAAYFKKRAIRCVNVQLINAQRLEPTWDPLCADPAFRKLYEEKRR